MMHTLVLMRHGESTANLDDAFAGWLDVPLTATGVEQARAAGRVMRDCGLEFDICFTSVLQRATHSAWHCLDVMDRSWLPVERSWRLNERHYGALQGLSKAETAARYGTEQVRVWRRTFDTRPPALPCGDPSTAHDLRYAALLPEQLPLSESMHDTVLRLRPLWEKYIAPQLASGQRPLIVAHGTTLRAFACTLGAMSGSEVEKLEVPNGAPIVYELDAQLRVQNTFFACIAVPGLGRMRE